jgi:peptide chain release factor 2
LEKQSARPDFWLEQVGAQDVMRRLAEQKKVVQEWRELERKVADIAELVPLLEEDTAFQEEIQSELDKIASELSKQELEIAFGDEYDPRNAILSVHAGAGGTESQDWAETLLRMYLRWAERQVRRPA